MPPELLESLALSNYASPRPRPIDPAVFFDIAKVRRSVEDATDLAVRAANGTTSASLRSSQHMGNGLLGGGGVLGIGGTPHTKLSRERKHRMRELATRKLSRAYHLDEIAASVATMQSASSVEEVAKLVLQRNGNDFDAKYVDFFHEKIPSRMLAESTSLESLNEIIRSRPTDVAVLRTRAVTRTFKEDLVGAAADLTEALAITRSTASQHKAPQTQMELLAVLNSAQKLDSSPDYHCDPTVQEDNQTSSLKPQLFFQRAGIYLTLACQTTVSCLDSSRPAAESPPVTRPSQSEARPHDSPSSTQARPHSLAARKITKSYAKRALRDYVSFLGFFEYTPGTPANAVEQHEPGSGENASARGQSATNLNAKDLENVIQCASAEMVPSYALIPHEHVAVRSLNGRAVYRSRSPSPPVKVFPISDLFAAAPPPDLPPYPVISREMVKVGSRPYSNSTGSLHSALADQEAITFHPLLIESLHSLLLCHSLVQTSPKEHLRHAHMVARLTRICDGSPIFLASRSPSRSDWVEILHRADNWIGLEQSWEALCALPTLANESDKHQKEETQVEARERIKQEAVMESLADERVYDDATFQAAVASRERRAKALVGDSPSGKGNGGVPKRLAPGDKYDFPIGSERAEAIARWVREAPTSIAGTGRCNRRGKKGAIRTDVHSSTLNQNSEQ